MDIEGFEVPALRGATELLRSHMPKLSIAVYHEFPTAEIIRSIVLQAQPKYQVSLRGILVRESLGDPRPYMLHAKV